MKTRAIPVDKRCKICKSSAFVITDPNESADFCMSFLSSIINSSHNNYKRLDNLRLRILDVRYGIYLQGLRPEFPLITISIRCRVRKQKLLRSRSFSDPMLKIPAEM